MINQFKETTMSVRLSGEEKQLLLQLAKKNKCSLSEMVRYLIRQSK